MTGAANNGSGLIRLTVTAHGLSTGDSVGVYGVTGTTEANGQWIITNSGTNTIDLQGSTFTNAYVSGGTVTNRGSYYGAFFGVQPRVARTGLTGTAQNGDDVVGVGVFNGGTASATATAAFTVNRNSGFGSGVEFFQGLEIEANCTAGVRMIAAHTWGIDLYGGGTATYSGGPIRLPNNAQVYARNNANNADIGLFRLRTDDAFELMGSTRISGNLLVTDGVNFDLGGTNGTKIGLSTSQKIGFWNVTPVIQPATTGTTTGFTANAGTAMNSASTSTGGTGTKAYTFGDVVLALKQSGIMAAS